MPQNTVRLKVVGGIVEEKKKKKVVFQLSRQNGEFTDQQVPGETQRRCNTARSTKNIKHHGQYLLSQDPRKSRFSHRKLMAIQQIACLLATLIFFLSCSKTQIDIYGNGSDGKQSARFIMYALSISTLALIGAILLRYICEFQLLYDQNKIYLKKKPSQWWIITFFTKSDEVKSFLLEVLIILPHPVVFLQGKTFTLFQTYDEIYLNHSYNDLLSLLLIAKVYIVLRALITISTYSSPRASRLCHQNGFQHSFLYVVKCILHEKPLTAIAVNFGILIMVWGYALKLSQGVLFLYNSGLRTGFEDYGNCFWCVFITMTTVGYGDYYPKTLPGRVIMLSTAISGVLISSLLIVSLSLYLQMIPSQSKSHITLLRLGEQKQLYDSAAKTMSQTIRVQQICSKKQGYQRSQLGNVFLKLKNNIESTKTRARKIKSMVDNENIIEEMNRLFYILKDNLKDIFIGQLKLRQQIGKIDQIQSIKLSFIREVQQMLSKASASKNSNFDPFANTTPHPA